MRFGKSIVWESIRNFIKTFFDKSPTMMYEDDSEWWSSSRFLTVYIGVSMTTLMLLLWVILSFIEHEILPIPESVIVLYLSTLTIILTGRYKQKIKELDLQKMVEGLGSKSNKNSDSEESNSDCESPYGENK